MAFTQGELDSIASGTLDYFIREKPHAQTIQDRPLYDAMRKAQKSFGGGKENISGSVKGAYTTTAAGYTHNDTVAYANPANLLRVAYAWKEHHAGITLTLTELKKTGISVVDSLNSAKTTSHSDADLYRLVNLLEDKFEDMDEGYARSMDKLMHRDGTGDAKALAGLKHFIADDPTAGTVGGLSRVTLPWFRNRARTTAHATATTSANGPVNTSTTKLADVLFTEFRQLRRYGGRPNLFIAGSDFLDALGKELRGNGYYTQMGFTKREQTDLGMAEISWNGTVFQYDPTLDDESNAKRCYVIDTRRLFPYVMEGEDRKIHTPARPATQYVMYRAVTWTGNLYMNQGNCHGVYDIA